MYNTELIDMSSPFTLENCLILACARTAPDVEQIQELVERGPDWQVILRRAERWGLAPLVYTNLRQAVPSGQVPEPVTERLRHLYHRETIHSVARREVLRAALLRLSDASIPVIVLKGAALSALVYPSPALRPMGDIDLLVHRRDLGRADELLRGMTGRASTPSRICPAGRLSARRPRSHLQPGPLCRRAASAARIPIEDFWERAQPAQIESVPTLVFSHEDLLLHLALHLVYAGGFAGHVRTLCDIGETCRRLAEAIDWSRFVARARGLQHREGALPCAALWPASWSGRACRPRP